MEQQRVMEDILEFSEGEEAAKKSKCEQLKWWNERTVKNLTGHITKCQALVILILNLLIPGLGTAISGCMLDEELILSECKRRAIN